MRTTHFTVRLYWRYLPLGAGGCLPLGAGGICLWVQEGCLPLGGGSVYHTPFHHTPTPREQNDWQTGVKTLPCSKLRLRVVNTITESMFLFNIL